MRAVVYHVQLRSCNAPKIYDLFSTLLDESSRIYRSTCYLSYAATSGCWKIITFLMHMHVCSKSQKDHAPQRILSSLNTVLSFGHSTASTDYPTHTLYVVDGFMPFQFRKGVAWTWTCPSDYLDVIFHKRSACRSLYLTLKQEIIYFDLYLLC